MLTFEFTSDDTSILQCTPIRCADYALLTDYWCHFSGKDSIAFASNTPYLAEIKLTGIGYPIFQSESSRRFIRASHLIM